MRGPSGFRKSDLRKAVEAAMKATGAPVQRIEIDREGRIIIITGNPGTAPGSANEWDTALKPEPARRETRR
jgi:hypothetical protein